MALGKADVLQRRPRLREITVQVAAEGGFRRAGRHGRQILLLVVAEVTCDLRQVRVRGVLVAEELERRCGQLGRWLADRRRVGRCVLKIVRG